MSEEQLRKHKRRFFFISMSIKVLFNTINKEEIYL